ncbi:MAG: DUF1116 domain-containing protein [Chloroflexota bacterium]
MSTVTPSNREAANQQVLAIFQKAMPRVIDIQPALSVIPGMEPDMILHSGPPIEWEQMCGPMQGGVLGALVYEGRAATLQEAETLAASGAIRFESCHDHDAVAPMTGIISPSMPVWVMEDSANHTRAYSNLNEGPEGALRYGANKPTVIARLHWMQDVLAPRLREAVLRLGELPIFPLVHDALTMGDECHSRNRAAQSLLVQKLLPPLIDSDLTSQQMQAVTNFIIGRDYFFLNLTMAACKAAWLAAEAVPYTSIITALSRNGVEFAIRLQGQWFTAPSPVVDGHYFPEFTAADANHDIGDSAITEASGLGGFVSGGATAVTDFIGGTAQELMAATLDMYKITASESTHFALPILDFRGSPTGIDVLKVLETGIRPFVTTGIAHREAGVGMIGAGRVRAPLACFEKAANTLLLTTI